MSLGQLRPESLREGAAEAVPLQIDGGSTRLPGRSGRQCRGSRSARTRRAGRRATALGAPDKDGRAPAVSIFAVERLIALGLLFALSHNHKYPKSLARTKSTRSAPGRISQRP